MNVFGEKIAANPFKNDKIYEKHLVNLLKQQNGFVVAQKCIGKKPTGSKFIVDTLYNERVIVSAKLQNVKGTAEEKVANEWHMLQYACEEYNYDSAYIVCGGIGWTLLNNEWFLSKRFHHPKVKIITHNQFLELLPSFGEMNG